MVSLGRVSHQDCNHPRILSAEERAVLFTYCGGHRVLCVSCNTTFYLRELVLDIVRRAHLCPWCRWDLTATVREHLYECALLPERIRRAAKAARDTARILVKQSQQLQENADVLMRAAEAAIAALRKTLRMPPAT